MSAKTVLADSGNVERGGYWAQILEGPDPATVTVRVTVAADPKNWPGIGVIMRTHAEEGIAAASLGIADYLARSGFDIRDSSSPEGNRVMEWEMPNTEPAQDLARSLLSKCSMGVELARMDVESRFGGRGWR